VRNDLSALEADGRIKRVHGGAILNEQVGFNSTSFTSRHKEHAAEKMLIARYAAEVVQDGDSILLDASSTAYCLAMEIKDRKRLRVITNGIDVAQLLAQNLSNSVILIGGVLGQDGSSVTGLFSEQIIQELRIQKAFVSCSGFSIELGMTEVHLEEAQLKRKAIVSAKEVFGLMDSSKFGKEDLTSFAHPGQITCLYTDEGLTSDWRLRLERAGICFKICHEEALEAK
jgi:DeoR family fructose operon transcriptional repressor